MIALYLCTPRTNTCTSHIIAFASEDQLANTPKYIHHENFNDYGTLYVERSLESLIMIMHSKM